VEIALFSSVGHVLASAPETYPVAEREFSSRKPSFHRLFTGWPERLGKDAFDLNAEPYRSLAALRIQRNRTVHSESALASLPMARSAVYSGVEGSRAITEHLLGPGAFRYGRVLSTYPLSPQPPFSTVPPIDLL
jgi:hypothetical protein